MNNEHRPAPRRRKRRKHFPWLFTMVLLTAGLLVFSLIQYRADMRPAPAEQPTEAQNPAKEGDTLTIAAAGDIGISPELLQYAAQADGTYDFTQIFQGVSPLLSDADLTVANLELNISGSDLTGENFKAPKELLSALKRSGVDILQTANTASVYNGLAGLTDTYDAINDAGMKPVGTFPTKDIFRKSKGFTMVEANGFKVAFVGFTKGVGNLQLPQGAEQSVNLLYTDYSTTYQKVDTDGIQAVMDNVNKAKPDITIALVHWGSEYLTDIAESQEKIRTLLLDNGVDAILGTHSHIVGKVDSVTVPGTLTAYSLGTLLSSDESADARESLVLKLTFTKGADGTTLTDWSYEPIYVATAQEADSPQILNIPQITGLYESSYIDKVSSDLYELLHAAEEDIAARVAPNED